MLQHADLKEMGVSSVGHRLTILGRVYEAKVKHNVRIEPDHYVPLCTYLYIPGPTVQLRAVETDKSQPPMQPLRS